MNFSEQYYKRREYMSIMQVPSFSETRRQLGEELAQVFFDHCPTALLKEANLADKLDGPGHTLWISPSDVLIGKVVLKPPLTATHMKALTHEGILSLGEQYEAQWRADMELEKEHALKNLEELLMMLAQRDKERAIAIALAQRDKEYRDQLARMNHDFEELIQSELAALEASLKDYYENLIDQKVADCMDAQGEELNEKIDDAVNAAVQELTSQFLADMAAQERELRTVFDARLEGQEERFHEELKYQEEVFSLVMRQLKHNLQCNNIASLMYVLCMERRKCLQEQQAIVNTTSQKINELEVENHQLHQRVEELEVGMEQKERQLKVREDCLIGVIVQFQKFINYALGAVPTQAEFLLSVEKMMTFELCQALVRTSSGKKHHLARLLMPWRPISLESIQNPPPMPRQQYHDCLNEHLPPKPPQEGSEMDLDDIKAVNYKEHIYIREDFRNRVEQGLFKQDSQTLWSEEVQNLVRLIRRSTLSTEELFNEEKPLSVASAASSVHFLRMSNDEPETAGLLAVNDSVILQKSKYSAKSRESMGSAISGSKYSGGQVALLGANDSVTLLKQKHVSTLETAEQKRAASHTRTSTKRRDTREKVPPPRDTIDPSRASEWYSQFEVVQAPSTATIHLKKPETKSARQSATSALFQCVSEVTLKLNKPTKTSSIGTFSGVRPSNISRKSHQSQRDSSTKSKQKRQSKTKRGESHSLRISQHRDSLELVSVHGRRNAPQRMLKNIILPIDTMDPSFPTQQFVINAPSENRDFPDVNFQRIAEVFNELYRPEKPWMIYKEKTKPPVVTCHKKTCTNFLKKPNVAKVLGVPGDQTGDDCTPKDFTVHRIHSLLDVLKKDDSLIRMFTKCQQ